MGVPRKLTLTLAALMTAQSLTGVSAPEQYRDVEWINSLIGIERGLAPWPGELVIWGPLAAVTATVTLLLLASVRPRNTAT